MTPGTVALLAEELNISLDAIVFPYAGRQMHLRLTSKRRLFGISDSRLLLVWN